MGPAPGGHRRCSSAPFLARHNGLARYKERTEARQHFGSITQGGSPASRASPILLRLRVDITIRTLLRPVFDRREDRRSRGQFNNDFAVARFTNTDTAGGAID